MGLDELHAASHEMLGIHPTEQPADRYRLLGLMRFESSPLVIANAADCRISFVRQFAAGPQGEAACQLLDLLADAKLCLLNAASKEDYDASLRNVTRAEISAVILPGTADASILIGSAASCDFVVASEFVSKRHCRLTRTGGLVRLEDLGSRNGTFVNGERLNDCRDLTPSDVVTLGRKTQLDWPGLLAKR